MTLEEELRERILKDVLMYRMLVCPQRKDSGQISFANHVQVSNYDRVGMLNRAYVWVDFSVKLETAEEVTGEHGNGA